MKRSSLFIVFSLFVLTACSGNGGAGSDSHTPVSVSMKIPSVSSVSAVEKPVSEGVASIEARVLNSAGSLAAESEKRDVVPNDEVVIDFVVPLGQMTFIVEAFSEKNSQGTLLFRGEKTENIVEGNNVFITIDMEAVGGGGAIQLSPQNPGVAKGDTLQFSVSGIDPGQIDWQVIGLPPDTGSIGVISSDGLYTAPSTIPYDTRNTALGVPVNIEIRAVDANSQEAVASTSLKLLTGAVLKFTEKTEPISIANANTESAGQRSIVFKDGVVYAAWAENGNILFAESSDGLNWSDQTMTVYFGSPDPGRDPALALADDGTVYIAFKEGSSQTGFRTALYRRKSGEISFESWSQNLNATGNNTERPSVAAGSDGTVFIAWAEDVDPDRFVRQWDVALQRLDALGNPLDSVNPLPIFIENDSGVDEREPVLAVSGVINGGQVFLAWTERGKTHPSSSEINLFARRSKNGGSDFLPAVQVNDTTDPRDVFRPSIAVGPLGTVYLAWESDTCLGDCDIRGTFDVGRLNGDVLEFGVDKFIRENASARQFDVSVVWDGANGVYVAFQERFAGSVGIFMAKSLDEGNTFLTSRIDEDTSEAFNKFAPSLAVDLTGRAFSIWTDRRGGVSGDYVWFARGE